MTQHLEDEAGEGVGGVLAVRDDEAVPRRHRDAPRVDVRDGAHTSASD